MGGSQERGGEGRGVRGGTGEELRSEGRGGGSVGREVREGVGEPVEINEHQ